MFGNQAANALSGLAENLGRLAVSPVQRWREASSLHKAIALGMAGASAYYVHSRGGDQRTTALTALGVAYGTSAMLHYPTVMGKAPAQGNGPTAVAPQQLSAMTQNAANALQGMQPAAAAAATAAGNGQSVDGLASLAGSLNAAAGALGNGGGGSEWSGLGQG